MHGATCVACNRPVMSMPQHCVRLVVSLNSGLIQLLPRCRAGGRVRVCVRQQTRLVSATPIACRSRVCTRTTDGHRSGVLANSCAVCRVPSVAAFSRVTVGGSTRRRRTSGPLARLEATEMEMEMETETPRRRDVERDAIGTGAWMVCTSSPHSRLSPTGRRLRWVGTWA